MEGPRHQLVPGLLDVGLCVDALEMRGFHFGGEIGASGENIKRSSAGQGPVDDPAGLG